MTDSPNAPQQPTYGQQPGYSAPSAYPSAPPSQPYQGGAYPSGGYGGYAAPPRNNTMAIVALVAGIGGLTILPGVASLVAVICGHIGLGQISRTNEGGRGMGIAGLIMGYVGVIGAVIGVIALALFFPLFIAGFQEFVNSVEQMG